MSAAARKFGWAGRMQKKRAPVLVCAVCLGAIPRDRAFISTVCSNACSMALCEARSSAIGAVAAQIRAGELPRAKDCTCVDCGAQAHDYDHRHYLRPLDVQPVCRSCNLARGIALDVHEFVKDHFGIKGSVSKFIEKRHTKMLRQLFAQPKRKPKKASSAD